MGFCLASNPAIPEIWADRIKWDMHMEEVLQVPPVKIIPVKTVPVEVFRVYLTKRAQFFKRFNNVFGHSWMADI